jgi:sortase A
VEDDLACGQRARPFHFVGHEHDGAPLGRSGRDHGVEYLASLGVETRVWLVEQQEARLARQGNGQREALALPGREPGVGDGGDAAQAEAFDRGVARCVGSSGGACREAKVFPHRQVVVTTRVVADEREVAPGAGAVGREVVTEHLGRAGLQRHEPGKQAEERRLARAVGTGDEQNLPLGHVEVDAGEGRKTVEQADGRAETNDDGHSASEPSRLIMGRRKVYGRPSSAVEPTLLCARAAPGRHYSDSPVTDTVRGGPTAGSGPLGPPRIPPPSTGGTPVPIGRPNYGWSSRGVLGGVGRTFITMGILILLFVAYQLWGTGLYTAQAQSDLKSQFNTKVHQKKVKPGAVDVPVSAPNGEAIAVIRIKKIDIEYAVVQGTTVPDLRKGPGHYVFSPMPGQLGNMAIAGHRTTYGHPFGDLDQLDVGDLIELRALDGKTYDYKVNQHWFSVDPHDLSVLDPVPGTATLTLTTCHPKYSASKRLIVKADLVPTPAVPAPLPAPRATTTRTPTGLSGESSSKLPALMWGLLAAIVGALWLLVFHRYRRWTVWFAGAIPFAIVLFVFYVNVERLLPTNY